MATIERGKEPTKGTKTKGGCIVLIMVLVGVALCFTVFGAIIGIPLIWAASTAVTVSGHCPHCRKVIHAPIKNVKPFQSVETKCPCCGYEIWFVESHEKMYPTDPDQADEESTDENV